MREKETSSRGKNNVFHFPFSYKCSYKHSPNVFPSHRHQALATASHRSNERGKVGRQRKTKAEERTAPRITSHLWIFSPAAKQGSPPPSPASSGGLVECTKLLSWNDVESEMNGSESKRKRILLDDDGPSGGEKKFRSDTPLEAPPLRPELWQHAFVLSRNNPKWYTITIHTHFSQSPS
mgnify:CR=1 FL=1